MRLLLSILLVLMMVPGWSGAERVAQFDRHRAFRARPVALFPGTPERRRLGALVFERGYVLASGDPEFGGFSSLLVDGDRFVLLSDSGEAIGFRLDQAGGLKERRFATLREGPGSGWDKADRDSESMTIDPATRQLWVGFENSNEIWRYAPGFARAETHSAPPAMHDWPGNRGPEAMVRLRDGRFVVIGESEPWPGGKGRAAIRFDGDPTIHPRRGIRFSYLPPKGYSPSDITELPDGRLAILNRRFTVFAGFRVVLTLIDPRAIRAGALVKGIELARFAPPSLHDNYEGIAAVREQGAIKLWIVSDDNQSIFQQTQLLKFRLDEARIAPRR
ncbi:MAG: hypothetical protein B7Y45_04145 [Sphingomonas sp. 28-66-16]|nr:MAG: hypothetical protein B7Y45_04145 [Sphingomonas sp. 28-66-16]